MAGDRQRGERRHEERYTETSRGKGGVMKTDRVEEDDVEHQ